MRRTLTGLGLGAAMLAVNCEQPRTELVVRVESEVPWGPGQSVQSVAVSVRRGGATGTLRSARTTVLGDGAGRLPLPLLVGVVDGDDDPNTPVWVEALGCATPSECDATTAVVAQRAVVRFVRGQTLELTLLLASLCEGALCLVDERCAVDVGRCEPATRAQVDLRPFTGVATAREDAGAADVTIPVRDSGPFDGADGADVAASLDARPADVFDAPETPDLGVSTDRPPPVDRGAPDAVVADAGGPCRRESESGTVGQGCCADLFCLGGRCASPTCLAPGEPCSGAGAGSCCDGYSCNLRPLGPNTCSRAPALTTSDPPVSCTTGAECAGSSYCEGGVCVCRRHGGACFYGNDCCGAMLCVRPGDAGTGMGTCQCRGRGQYCRLGGNDCCAGTTCGSANVCM